MKSIHLVTLTQVTFNIPTQCLTDLLSETATRTQHCDETPDYFRHAAASHEDGYGEPGHADLLPVPGAGAGEGAEGEELPDRPAVLLRADRCE